jgi:hypothetical protein
MTTTCRAGPPGPFTSTAMLCADFKKYKSFHRFSRVGACPPTESTWSPGRSPFDSASLPFRTATT